ncbi:DnaJ -like protein subfamily C member 11 [Trichinella pseudospiralis]|uniref:DnaJ-like protein subfamily C member 11 n=1 Tax=Trichinella pseudospiralis TaxID=6337 RepID=A0A0V1IFG8_TRIPS|nr:DnaJ -like protein subfamily C member 11 [Trichinella pseudospiralis]KRY72504.1 DnaJ -like protein subfamily C member 11 [Trichinella pseudospiralis]KRZ21521.1 DnaJ -like protein subfamily C member 11 [Trichinella pseudospiralis]KRZ32681.1 DnaJ -like protein subfamily C member 11 [Trichinella pseudospiralis]
MESFQHEEDYYAIFNIPRNASQEEITRAFRRLSLFSHPDRFKTLEEKSAARIYFEKYQRIYEVLSDPEKRLIYDSIGEKGLQIEGWEIIPRQKGVAEIRAEARRLIRLHELEILDNLSRPKGSFNLFIDATQLFDRDITVKDLNLSTFEVKGISCSQSVMFPWTTNSSFFANAVVNSMNSVGSGKFSGGFRSRTFDSISWEMIVEYADDMSCNIKLSRLFLNLLEIGIECGILKNGSHYSAGIFMDIAKNLSENVIGVISAKAGTQCSVTTTLNYSRNQFNMAVASTVGVPVSMLAATCVFSTADNSNIIGTTMKFGTMGLIWSHTQQHTVSNTSIQTVVQIHYPVGAYFSIKVKRANQTYQVNFTLFEEEFGAEALGVTLLLQLASYALHRFILKPCFKKIWNKFMKPSCDDEVQNSTNQAKHEEHEALIQLMRKEAVRLTAVEEQRKGLVIIDASYGCNRSNDINVTIPLQLLVRNSKLIIQKDVDKNSLNGFYDPYPYEQKWLKIRYKFLEQLHECTISEHDAVEIPKQNHRIA